MAPYIRFYYWYDFDAAVRQHSDPSFSRTFDKGGPLKDLPPPPPGFTGDPTKVIDETWWLPLMSRVVLDLQKVDLQKVDLQLDDLNPMAKPLCPLHPLKLFSYVNSLTSWA